MSYDKISAKDIAKEHYGRITNIANGHSARADSIAHVPAKEAALYDRKAVRKAFAEGAAKGFVKGFAQVLTIVELND